MWKRNRDKLQRAFACSLNILCVALSVSGPFVHSLSLCTHTLTWWRLFRLPLECAQFFFVLFILQFNYCLSDGKCMFQQNNVRKVIDEDMCDTHTHTKVVSVVFAYCVWFICKRFNRFMTKMKVWNCVAVGSVAFVSSRSTKHIHKLTPVPSNVELRRRSLSQSFRCWMLADPSVSLVMEFY